jgi:response regulator RpfG family c-di-GMP phosphodiesterase
LATRPIIGTSESTVIEEALMRDDIDLAEIAAAAEAKEEVEYDQSEYDEDVDYVKRVMNSERIKEFRRVREECSRRLSAMTHEERQREIQEAVERCEQQMGRKIPVADYSGSAGLKRELAG